jgi:hypothetical protein
MLACLWRAHSAALGARPAAHQKQSTRRRTRRPVRSRQQPSPQQAVHLICRVQQRSGPRSGTWPAARDGRRGTCNLVRTAIGHPWANITPQPPLIRPGARRRSLPCAAAPPCRWAQTPSRPIRHDTPASCALRARAEPELPSPSENAAPHCRSARSERARQKAAKSTSADPCVRTAPVWVADGCGANSPPRLECYRRAEIFPPCLGLHPREVP